MMHRTRTSGRLASGVSLCAALALASVATAQSGGFTLTDAAAQAGLTAPYHPAPGMTAGVAAADFDADGDVDVFVPNAEGRCDLLYRNRGDGTFEEVAQDLGVSGCELGDKPRSRAALWLDYDGDGRLDLLVAGDAFNNPIDDIRQSWTTPRLYRQLPDGSFTNASDSAGLTALDLISDHRSQQPGSTAITFQRHFGSVAAGDLNGDGYPEVMLGLWNGLGENEPQEIGARLLLNVPGPDGGRTFEDVTIATLAPGVADPGLDRFGSFWQIVMHDFNGDGLLDVYAAVDMDENHLWLNRGATPDPARPGVLALNPFEDVTHDAGVTSPEPETDMGVALADCNNNGLFDIYITKTDTAGSDIDNDFYLATSQDPTFADIADEAGLSGNEFGWGWGTTFQDLDRDGWQDLAMTNGFNSCNDLPRLMLNNANPADLAFTEKPSPALNRANRGSTIIAADIDRDGDQDLIHTIMLRADAGCASPTVQLLRNDPDCAADCPRWLAVRPRMAGPNTHAIGAVVRVRVGGDGDPLVLSRLITAGTSMAGQEPAEAFFGLGSGLILNDPVTVTIQWPDGSPDTVIEGTVGSLAGRVVPVGPCSPVDLAEPYGSLDLFDLLEYLGQFEDGDPRRDLAEPFGSLDIFDVLEAIQLIEDGCP